MYQKIVIVGHLGRDPEMRYAPNGNPVTSFSVATGRKYKGADGQQVNETGWFRCSAWNRLAEVCNDYLKKGTKVLVEGRLAVDSKTGGPRIFKRSDGTMGCYFEIVVAEMRILSSKEKEDGHSGGDGEFEYTDEGVDDDIPF